MKMPTTKENIYTIDFEAVHHKFISDEIYGLMGLVITYASDKTEPGKLIIDELPELMKKALIEYNISLDEMSQIVLYSISYITLLGKTKELFQSESLYKTVRNKIKKPE